MEEKPNQLKNQLITYYTDNIQISIDTLNIFENLTNLHFNEYLIKLKLMFTSSQRFIVSYSVSNDKTNFTYSLR